MPIYDYRCASCKNEFEALTRSSDSNGLRCPSCGGAKLSRLISRFAVSRSLTPCGTPASERSNGCGFNPATGGCGCCQK